MSNIFLSIGEVKGESAVIGHVGESEALSWGWRLTQTTLFSHAIAASAKSFVLLQGQSEGLIDGGGIGFMVDHVSCEGPC
ncbi:MULTISPECIES: hypothetical protein [unclassified Caballeronia]|uniref:hypothetical protein n=1 Tax=unclassified Caballeronia TaxID=2646786 RepID=UPI002866017B|nr:MULTISPECIES: hypothetical protein [unclassified Caballeronia]MDR5825532.1 hypothetical protein [Caballeronia sp. LZ043]MDR5883410.1 hypothetical protein [Caballeronia sp. LZ032]